MKRDLGELFIFFSGKQYFSHTPGVLETIWMEIGYNFFIHECTSSYLNYSLYWFFCAIGFNRYDPKRGSPQGIKRKKYEQHRYFHRSNLYDSIRHRHTLHYCQLYTCFPI
jgi:hypothetical protein